MSFRIDLHPSRVLLRLQGVQLALALAACLHLVHASAFALLLCLPLLLAVRKLVKPQPGPRALVLMADEWYLVYEQDVCKAELQQYFHCTEHLLILHFRIRDAVQDVMRTEQVLVLPDSADCKARRALRALLCWYRFAPLVVAD